MVFRKPYAFIIRHFRIIHLIMFACSIFVLNSLISIRNLFSTLQKSNTLTYAGATNYINNIVFFVILAIIAISTIVLFLLKAKKKPVRFYSLTCIYMVVLLILFFYFFSVLRTLQYELISADTILFVKDISFLMSVPIYAIIVISFIRGIGFNIKQFNFSKDFEELEIVDDDSDEFEILIGQNNYIYERKIRRAIREVKYYIYENKFVITLISFGVLLILLVSGLVYYNKNVKKYNVNDLININGISYLVNDSYITARDYKGDIIKQGYKYVVVDMTFYNASLQKKALNLDLINLTDGKLVYRPSLNFNSKFFDLGMPYKKNDMIDSNSSIDNTLVFEIPEGVKTKKFTLRVQYDIDSSLNKIVVRYKKFNVAAKDIDVRIIGRSVNLRETLNSNVVQRNRFSVTINNYSISDVYDNKYVVCTSLTKCDILSSVISSTSNGFKTMLIIDYDGFIYDDANFTKYFDNYNKVFQNFGLIRYRVGDEEYIKDIDVIDKDDVPGKLFARVDRTITKATSISLELKFRDNIYIIPLKKNQ